MEFRSTYDHHDPYDLWMEGDDDTSSSSGKKLHPQVPFAPPPRVPSAAPPRSLVHQSVGISHQLALPLNHKITDHQYTTYISYERSHPSSSAQQQHSIMPLESLPPSPQAVGVNQHQNVGGEKSSGFELFVGNLSFFCKEQHLCDLFNAYATVTNAHVVRGDDKVRSLLYGFVSVSCLQEWKEMQLLLNGHLFMGRNMRVESIERTPTNPNETKSTFVGMVAQNRVHGNSQAHVAISSNFLFHQVIEPTEVFLRRVFLKYGTVIDVQVNWYTRGDATTNKQEGYAFVAFESPDAYNQLMLTPLLIIDGITLHCTKSKNGFRHGPTISRSGGAVSRVASNRIPLGKSKPRMQKHQVGSKLITTSVVNQSLISDPYYLGQSHNSYTL